MQNEEDWAPLRRPSSVEAQCRPLCRQQPADLLLLRMLHSQLKRDDAWKSSPKSKRKPRVAVSKKHNSDGIESVSSVCVRHFGITAFKETVLGDGVGVEKAQGKGIRILRANRFPGAPSFSHCSFALETPRIPISVQKYLHIK